MCVYVCVSMLSEIVPSIYLLLLVEEELWMSYTQRTDDTVTVIQSLKKTSFISISRSHDCFPNVYLHLDIVPYLEDKILASS